jgi:hypothetical protein
VRVLEKEPGGPLCWTVRGRVPRSLGHRNRDEAVAFAHEKAAELARSHEILAGDKPTVARVLGEYLDTVTARKRPAAQREDRRCAEQWTRFLGSNLDLERELDDAKLRLFVELRRSGEIDARGRYPIPEAQRRPTRARTPQADMAWLRIALHNAMRRRRAPGRFLLQFDPTRC